MKTHGSGEPVETAEDLTGVWRMRSGQLVTVLPMFAPAGRYFEQLTQRTWTSDGRSRENESFDLIERIPGPRVHPAPDVADLERAS